jgi:serine protease Do
VVRGWIGVTVQELTEELAESFGLKKARGALVTDVEDDSPARKAGLQRGDIILEINGQTLENLSDLPRIVAALPVGAKARMTLFRDGRTKEASVTIGTQDRDQQPAKREVAKSKNLLGLSVIDITPEIKSRYRLSVEKGVLVAAVEADGPAAGTLHAGDVILELNSEPVESAAALHALLGNSKSNQLVRLLVQRRDQTLYATVRTR